MGQSVKPMFDQQSRLGKVNVDRVVFLSKNLIICHRFPIWFHRLVVTRVSRPTGLPSTSPKFSGHVFLGSFTFQQYPNALPNHGALTFSYFSSSMNSTWEWLRWSFKHMHTWAYFLLLFHSLFLHRINLSIRVVLPDKLIFVVLTLLYFIDYSIDEKC